MVAATAAAVAARATAADTSIITHGSAGWARRRASGEGDGRRKRERSESDGERERGSERQRTSEGGMRLKGTTRGRVARQAGVEEEEEGRRGGGGGKRSLGSTGVKSRYQTQAALPPSFNPSLLSSKRPCHTSPLAPRQPATPGPPARRSSSSSHAYPPRRALSKPLPRFHLRFLLAARVARGWVVNHPRATFGSHARTTETTASDDISARWRGRVYDGRRINSADGSMRRRFLSLFPSSFPLFLPPSSATRIS